MHTRAVSASIICLAVLSCGWLDKAGDLNRPATAEILKKHALAYGNIAASGTRLKNAQKAEGALLILACKTCRVILDEQVRKAGFADLKEFIYYDVRIHLALQQVYYIRILELVSELSQEAGSEGAKEFCRAMDKNQAPTSGQDAKNRDARRKKLGTLTVEERKRLEKNCLRARRAGKYLEAIGRIGNKLVRFALRQSELALIRKNLAGLEKTLLNPSLPGEFQHSRGGGFDD